MAQRVVNKALIKTRLTNEGRWPEFVKVREAHRRTSGQTGVDCWIAALEMTDGKGRKFADPIDIPAGVMLQPAPLAGTTYRKPSVAADTDTTPKAPLPPKQAAEVASRQGGVRESVEWVAANLYMPEPDLSQAPSGMALSLLLDCQAFPEVRKAFWSQVFVKLLPTEREMKLRQRTEGENEDLSDALKTYEDAEQKQRERATLPSNPPLSEPEQRETDDGY